MSDYDKLRPVRWQDGQLLLIDQRKLPLRVETLAFDNAAKVTQAIKDMVVRGAPAIGVTAAYAVVLAAREAYAVSGNDWRESVQPVLAKLKQARPTAVNLQWAVNRMLVCCQQITGNPVPTLLEEARRILTEDIQANKRIGEWGAALLPDNCRVMTHCNAGALATGGYGTALGVIRSGFAAGKITQIYAGETRPWLQGARLTAWELLQDSIPVTLLADSAAALLMQQGRLDWVITGADRVAANGDAANKIGTYALAMLARQHGVKFMIAAPISTIDPEVPDGAAIPLEQRDGSELLGIQGEAIAAQGAAAWNPVFDVTPAHLIDALVTEKGVIQRPDRGKIEQHLQSPAPGSFPARRGELSHLVKETP